MLAELLRTSRLALLFGQPGSDKTALLKHDLMPLLHRRAADRLGPATARESGVVVPFPDRRGRSSGRAAKRRREIVIYFDDWSDRPLEALHARIQLAAAVAAEERSVPRTRLGDTLSLLSGRVDANFIVLLDRCEQLLSAPARLDFADFTDELVDAINQPRLAANFLLSLDEEARPRLGELRSRIPGFDDFSLKLGRFPAVKPAIAVPKAGATEPIAIRPLPLPEETIVVEFGDPLLPMAVGPAPSAPPPVVEEPVASPPPPKPPKPRQHRAPPTRVPIKTEDVYRLIETTLSLTVTDGAEEPFAGRATALATPAEPAWPPMESTDEASAASLAVDAPMYALREDAAPPNPPRWRRVLAGLAGLLRLKPRDS